MTWFVPPHGSVWHLAHLREELCTSGISLKSKSRLPIHSSHTQNIRDIHNAWVLVEVHQDWWLILYAILYMNEWYHRFLFLVLVLFEKCNDKEEVYFWNAYCVSWVPDGDTIYVGPRRLQSMTTMFNQPPLFIRLMWMSPT